MSDGAAGPSRRTVLILAGSALVLVVVLAIAIPGITGSGSADEHGSGTTPGGASATASATPIPHTTARPKPVKSTAPSTPQPTRTVAIGSDRPVVVSHELTASIVRMQAVKGVADGPGEIGGPSVRFTVRLANRTGESVSLETTQVNAYYGSRVKPAVPLRMPGARPFPRSIQPGRSADGIFVFNIPVAYRAHVQLTVDTSIHNPVLDFRGAVPR